MFVRNDFYEKLTVNIEELEGGDESYLHLVYYVFAQGDVRLAGRGAKAIRTVLEAYTMQKMIRLSETFRQYTSMDWFINWGSVSMEDWKGKLESEEDYIYALILGSFHPNGYFREKCVLHLGKYENTLSYLLLRMNDWVEPIREQAGRLAKKKIASCSLKEIILASQALEKVKNSGRRVYNDLEEVKQGFKERIQKDIAEFPLWEIAACEFSIRKSVYRLLFRQKILEFDKADFLLDRERHSFCQAIIISGILKNYSCSMDTIDKYLKHKASKVRKEALEYKLCLIKKDWPGLEDMLLDTNVSIRGLAAYTLEKYRGMSIPEFYIEHLQDDNPMVPILGLGETGTPEMAELLMTFLEWDTEKVASSTLLSLSKLLGADGEDLYWSYLLDARASVSKAAYLAAKNNRVYYGSKELYEQFQITEMEHVCRYLILLLLRENSWSRLPYLIYLYQDEKAYDYHNKILGCMRCRNNYAKISRKQAQTIEHALEAGSDVLPKELVKGIRFDLNFVSVIRTT